MCKPFVLKLLICTNQWKILLPNSIVNAYNSRKKERKKIRETTKKFWYTNSKIITILMILNTMQNSRWSYFINAWCVKKFGLFPVIILTFQLTAWCNGWCISLEREMGFLYPDVWTCPFLSLVTFYLDFRNSVRAWYPKGIPSLSVWKSTSRLRLTTGFNWANDIEAGWKHPVFD